MSAGFVSVPVVPTFKGMSKEFAQRLEKPAKNSGERAGKAMSAPLEKSVQNLERQVKVSSSKLQDLDRAYEKSASKQAAQKEKVEAATLKLQDAEEKYQEALEKGDKGTAELAKVKDAKARVIGETEKLEQAEIDVRVAEQKHQEQLEDLEATSGKLTEAQNELAESTDGSGKSFAEAAEESERFSKAMDGVALGITGMATGAVAGLASIGSDFQEMSRTIAVGSGATGDALRDLEESAMDVATNVPVSFDEAANAIAGLNTMTGESGPALERLSEQVLNASNLLGEDGVSNANDFGNALSQWEIDAADGADALDGLFSVTQNYGIGLGEITEHLNTFGSVLNNAGFSMEESAVLFGSLEKSGLSVSRVMPGLNKAFRGWAEEGLNVQETLADTVGQIESAETAQEALALATDAFGAEGAQRLTTAIRNGSFALEDFDTALGDTSGLIDQTAEDNRTLGESFELFKNEALVAIEPIATELIDWLIPAMEGMVGQFEDALDWISENKELIEGLAVGVGVAAAAFVAWRGSVMMINGAMKIFQVATALSTAGIKGLNTAMKANIFGLIATAIAGLVAGLIWFFTKTETGQELWEKFTTALADGWDWVVEKLSAGWEWLKERVFDPFMAFAQETLLPIWESALESITEAWEWLTAAMQSAWENVLQPTFSAIADIAVWLWENVLQNVFQFILGYWEFMIGAMQLAWENILRPTFEVLAQVATWLWENVLSPTFAFIGRAWDQLLTVMKWAWENILRPTFEVLGDVAVWLAENVLAPAFDFIGNAWDNLSTAIKWAWENIIRPAWDAVSSAATWMWENVLSPTFSFIGDAWTALSDGIRWAYDHIIKPAWDALGNALTWLYENVVQPVLGWIGDRWTDMADILEFGWHWIRDNVFTPLGDGLETVQGWFQTAVDSIRSIWDGIRSAAAKPVRFVVDTVYNNGILPAWNAVAGLVGLGELDKVDLGELGNFASGGILPGYTPGRDPYTFIEPNTGMRIGLSGGEAVVRPEATRVLGSAWVDGVNAAARVGGEAGVADYLYGGEKKRSLGGFYSGGVIGSITDWVKQYYPMMTITSTLRNTNDYHGQGLAVDFSNGTDTTPQMQSAAQNLYSNYGKGLLELIHSPFNHNVKHGKDVGDGFGFYGAGTMNAHRNHVHVASQQPLGDPKNMVEMVWDGAKAVFTSIKDRVTGLFSPIIDSVKGKLDSFSAPGIIGGLPGAMFSTLWNAAKDLIMGKADEASSYSGAAGSAGNAESWREMAMAAMRRQGFNADDPAQVNAMLAQIASESGGDPNIAQQIVDVNGTGESAGVGLLQIIPGTFAAHRDPELPDDRRDPWANMNAALRYYRSRYGDDLTTTWGHGHGYASGGIVDLMKLYDQGGWLEHGKAAFNMSGKPEPVLNHDQWDSVSGLVRTLGDLVPAIEGQTKVIAKAVDDTQAWLAKAGDYNSIEGINARQGVRRVLDLGLDLPGSDVIKMVLDGEDTLWDSRARAASNLDTIVEKEKALEEARKAVADLNNMPEGVSEDDQKKIDEAQKALDDAKAEKAKAESDDARAKAADKVTEAEKNLKEAREEVDKNSEENAKKHAEEVTKANDAVAKAEQELVAAKKQQAMDLDNIVLVSQGQVSGLIPMAEKFADQLVSIGAPAAAVGAGLAQVTGGLSAMAAFIGPAGLTLGMALDMLKVGIGIIKAIVGAIKDLIAKIRKARLDALKALADGWSVIADYAKLIVDLQGRVTSLQQALIRGANEQREAEYNLMLAQQDRYIAEAEGALKVAEARLALDAEIKRGAIIAQLKLMGLHEDWDSYMAYQALESQGVLQEWSDSAISALFTYEKARAEALKGELSARLEQIKAEAALAEAQRQNVRNQQDLLKAQERLIRMSAEVAGVDLVEATGTAQVAKLMAEMAEVKQAMDKNTLGRWGAALGAQGSHANEYRGQQAQYESLQQALDAVIAETGVQIDRGNLDRTLKLMGRAAYRGGDPMAVLRSQLPELAQAETALKINESLKPVYDAQDQRDDLARQVEDFTAEIDLYEKTTPLERTLKGLDYTIASLEQSSQAWAEGNEELRGEYLAAAKANRDAAEAAGVDWKLDSKYANAGVRDQIRRETTIHLDGEKMYTADQIDQLLAEVTAGTNGSYRIVRSASEVAVARRKERV